MYFLSNFDLLNDGIPSSEHRKPSILKYLYFAFVGFSKIYGKICIKFIRTLGKHFRKATKKPLYFFK